jgi:hypothetical protein
VHKRELDLRRLAQEPQWFPHRYDATRDVIQFIELSREDHRSAVFATDEYLPKDRRIRPVNRNEAVKAAGPGAPLHFILHSAFCCSTMLARLLDQPCSATTFKEPMILNDIVGIRRRGAESRVVAELLDNALGLLARPFESGERVILKPSNIINSLAPGLLALRPQSAMLLLYAPLETFVTSVAKKGLDGRLWVRELAAGQRTDRLLERLGFSDAELFKQSDLQIAASTWLAQQMVFNQMITAAPHRVRTLDSQTLLDRPQEVLTTLAELFDLATPEPSWRDVLSGPAFNSHAKTGQAFSVDDRKAEYSAAASAHADEISKVVRWAEIVAQSTDVPLTLGNGLLDHFELAE